MSVGVVETVNNSVVFENDLFFKAVADGNEAVLRAFPLAMAVYGVDVYGASGIRRADVDAANGALPLRTRVTDAVLSDIKLPVHNRSARRVANPSLLLCAAFDRLVEDLNVVADSGNMMQNMAMKFFANNAVLLVHCHLTPRTVWNSKSTETLWKLHAAIQEALERAFGALPVVSRAGDTFYLEWHGVGMYTDASLDAANEIK